MQQVYNKIKRERENIDTQYSNKNSFLLIGKNSHKKPKTFQHEKDLLFFSTPIS